MKLPPLKIADWEVELPIIQGGMAVRISLAPLAAAVANMGGMGVIGASGMHPDELRDQIREARRLAKNASGKIGVNIMVALYEFADLVKTAIKEKVDFIIVGAGFSRDIFRWGKEGNVPIIPVVSSLKAAKLAEISGASAVVVEGKEAGGHLGTDQPLFSILPDIIGALKIPVIAAGGILHGWDIAKALRMGASGVQMGTRFAASKECSADPKWKEAYLKAKPEDSVLIKSPVGMPGRAVLTPFVKKLLAGKLPPIKFYTQCERCLKECRKNYCIFYVLVKAQEGDVENGLVFSGERVGEIKSILSVKEIIANLIREFEEATAGVENLCLEGS
jgi:NAD(P)H-dependent flavin oxidoreductase YrpB (nitropropane dioxygenase family)